MRRQLLQNPPGTVAESTLPTPEVRDGHPCNMDSENRSSFAYIVLLYELFINHSLNDVYTLYRCHSHREPLRFHSEGCRNSQKCQLYRMRGYTDLFGPAAKVRRSEERRVGT